MIIISDKKLYKTLEPVLAAWASFKVNFKALEGVYIKSVLKKAKVILDEEFI